MERPALAYLTMTAGSWPGTNFRLDPDGENRIGRGLDGAVVLADALCSRVHAIVEFRDQCWKVRDVLSRNGTYVNGQKIDEASLGDGHLLKVGNTEFCFHLGEPAESGKAPARNSTQTIVKQAGIDPRESLLCAAVARDESQQAQDLLLLYQLCIRLLACAEANEVLRVSLDLLRERTRSTIVGFLWLDDNGALRSGLSSPEQSAEQVQLSESLTRTVCEHNQAVWVADHRFASTSESLSHYADGLCVPLASGGRVLGALHAYLKEGRYHQQHFDFMISLANIAAVALMRARHQASVEIALEQLKSAAPGYDELIGQSPPMQDLKSKISRLARASGCVLIRGESGAGKELVARAVHRASPRADRPLLCVNCAAIPENLLESQLFGHKAGAFTGADRDHQGLFQQADMGTLFLDEVGELTLPGQSKLLRILEGHPFLPVGSTAEVRVDVRVIAATNQDLQTFVAEKRFREDLYYRLSVFELHVPPLRDRGGDLALLIDFFLDHFRLQHGRPGLELASDAREKLLAYQWPGNVRQLRNVIDSAVVLAAGKRIESGDLALRDSGRGELESLRIDYWERKLITEALRRCGGHVPDAARLTGLGRATLYRKIEEYGIEKK